MLWPGGHGQVVQLVGRQKTVAKGGGPIVLPFVVVLADGMVG